MTSISSIETVTQGSQPLPSRTPSPYNVDLSRPSAIESNHALAPPGKQTRKGKAKQNVVEQDDDDAELSESSSANMSYPPIDDQEAETRRVEENLRRWEVAERQRRKAARESADVAPSSTSSLVGDVTRRASFFWSSGRQTHKHATSLSSDAGGKHLALQSRESIDVPLRDITAPSPGGSPLPPLSSTPLALQNPFLASSEILPLEDAINTDDPLGEGTGKSAMMSPSTEPPSSHPSRILSGSPPSRPVLLASSSSFSGTKHPPPRPLDLPPPRTPPPRIATPSVILPQESNDTEKPMRWWHEWLCGCSEGHDRGGDYQAGRTNPFE